MKTNEIEEMNLSEMLINRDERLLDYITNLQEEIERQSKAQMILDDMLADYKSKIDKAIEYIENIKNSNTEIVENVKGKHIDVGYAVPALEDIKDILKGE